MKLCELTLNETADEDRALISLSSALYPLLMAHRSTTKPHVILGTIGDLVDTPLEILNGVTIELMSNDLIFKRLDDTPNEDSVALALWDPDTRSVVVNLKHLAKPIVRKTITHELRHALDDYKSGFAASDSDSYFTARKKEHRNSPDARISYLAAPGEINARYVQMMHLIVLRINRLVKEGMGVEQLRPAILDYLKLLLETNHLSTLFPEKEKSRDYKRIIKRSIEFIDKEIEYRINN